MAKKRAVADVEEQETDADYADHPATVAVGAYTTRATTAKRNAQAVERASAQWPQVRSFKDWERIVEEAADDYASGAFLIGQLGAESTLDPALMATLLHLRANIIAEWGLNTSAELMLLDIAILDYRLALRIEGWIGNLAFLIESEAFGVKPLSVEYM